MGNITNMITLPSSHYSWTITYASFSIKWVSIITFIR